MSSQNRVDPFQIRPESGLSGRWPIRWRHGTSVEGGTRFWPLGFRVYPILAIALFFVCITFTFHFMNKLWSQVSSVLVPGTCLQFLSSIGFSVSTARQFLSIECLLTRALALSASQFLHNKKLPTNLYEYAPAGTRPRAIDC